MSAFAEDLKRWMERERRPRDGSQSARRLRTRDVAVLFWRHGAVWPTAIYRMSAWCNRHGIRAMPTILERLNMVLFGIEISSSVPIGPGLYLVHPVGTVLMAARIGANATFISAVTLGMRDTHDFPVLGDGVMVGAGARILGRVTLGGVRPVGATAVGISDRPAGPPALRVPAKLLP